MNEQKPLQDLGWANGWDKDPQIVQDCRKAGHARTDVDAGPPMRGLDHVVTCTICGYRYHYDSSD